MNNEDFETNPRGTMERLELAKKMRNEIVGLCSIGEHYMREFAGNTNYHCLIDAVKAFDEADPDAL